MGVRATGGGLWTIAAARRRPADTDLVLTMPSVYAEIEGLCNRMRLFILAFYKLSATRVECAFVWHYPSVALYDWLLNDNSRVVYRAPR